jgi:hypothetical protein
MPLSFESCVIVKSNYVLSSRTILQYRAKINLLHRSNPAAAVQCMADANVHPREKLWVRALAMTMSQSVSSCCSAAHG